MTNVENSEKTEDYSKVAVRLPSQRYWKGLSHVLCPTPSSHHTVQYSLNNVFLVTVGDNDYISDRKKSSIKKMKCDKMEEHFTDNQQTPDKIGDYVLMDLAPNLEVLFSDTCITATKQTNFFKSYEP